MDSTASTSDKERKDGLPDDSSSAAGPGKKAKASSSSATHSHDQGISPPPSSPAPPRGLYDLSDIAHDAIASHLSRVDMHCMMESSPWLLKTYGGRVKEVNLRKAENKGPMSPASISLSIMSHRPGLARINTTINNNLRAIVMAMRKGYLNKLQTLHIQIVSSSYHPLTNWKALCDALAEGLCPEIHSISIDNFNADGLVNVHLLPSLGDALRSRMEEGKGCCGLKSLEITGGASSLSPLLLSGACEALEEFKIGDFDCTGRWSVMIYSDLSDWLSWTKANHLRSLTLPPDTFYNVFAALCSPGVAPKLQNLCLLRVTDGCCIRNLSQAIGQRSWPDLQRLKIQLCFRDDSMKIMVLRLVDAIGVGAPELLSLNLGSDARTERVIGPEGGMALASMIRGGGCPLLKDLDMSYIDMGDDAVVELVRALEKGAPCNTTLRRLFLSGCDITSVGMVELAQAMGRGTLLPHLEVLSLGFNKKIKDDGMVALAQAMSTGRALQSLRILSLEGVGMKGTGARALFQAFRQHNPCPHLKKLDAGSNYMGDVGVLELAKVIEAGALQHLGELGLREVGMGEEGFKSLVKAIVTQDQPNPGCPRLKMLNVSRNWDVGDGGVMYLAQLMKIEGAMQHLLVLILSGIGMGHEGIGALLKSLKDSRVCPSLRGVFCLAGLEGLALETTEELLDEANAVRGQDRRSSRVTMM